MGESSWDGVLQLHQGQQGHSREPILIELKPRKWIIYVQDNFLFQVRIDIYKLISSCKSRKTFYITS
jgi:hypothetical protein